MSLAEAKRVFTRPTYFIAYGFGSGLSPRAPGTAGSLLALLLFLPARDFPFYIHLAFILVALIAGIFVCGRVASQLEIKDPSVIVWDEFVGMWISLLFLPAGWIWYLAAFAAFRFFDILKPWPVNWADEKLEGGPGIMLDDVVAGLYALLAVQAAAQLVLYLP